MRARTKSVLWGIGLAYGLTGCGGSAPSDELYGEGGASGAGGATVGGAAGTGGTSGVGGGSGIGGSSGASGAVGVGGASGASGTAGSGVGGVAGSGGTGGSTTEPHPAPAPVGCVTDVSPGEHVFSCDGLTHDVSVPQQCITSACGLVVDVHGGTMSGKMEDNNTGMRELGRQHGYVVLQPNAVGGLWNGLVDDDKVFAFMQSVVIAWHVDPDRVHMTGFSQGGYMTWRFICRWPEILASAAPAAASEGGAIISPEVGCSFTGTNVPSKAIDMLYMAGRQDGLVTFQSALAQRDAVVAALGFGNPHVIAADSTYTRTQWMRSDGRVFEFIEHDYTTDAAFGVAILGHCYPGSTDFVPTEPGQLMGFGCKTPVSFHWGEEVIRFFMRHPRR